MTFAPNVPVETLHLRPNLNPWSVTADTQGLVLWQGGGGAAAVAWPLANLAMGWTFQINERQILYEAFYGSGTIAGGNLDIGIYDMAGTRLASTGTQVRATSAHTNINWTDLTLEPGQYVAAMSADSTANYAGWIPLAGLCEATGVWEAATSFVLPATITWVRTTRAFIPYFGFNSNSVSL